MTRIAILCILGLLADDRAERLFERMKFQPANPEDDVARRVSDVLLRKEHWVGAYGELREKYGPFPDNLDLTVDFAFNGEELARAIGRGSGKSTISFNLKKLAAAQRKMDEFETTRKEAEARGQKVVFKVPPVKFDRMIYHELTHVIQAGYDAPLWFLEGMAQLAGDDLNAICGFAVEKKNVRDIDATLSDRGDIYARGHLFWKWLDTRYAAQKTVQLTVYERRPWKESLEEAVGRSWAAIVATEREWSEKEIEKLR